MTLINKIWGVCVVHLRFQVINQKSHCYSNAQEGPIFLYFFCVWILHFSAISILHKDVLVLNLDTFFQYFVFIGWVGRSKLDLAKYLKSAPRLSGILCGLEKMDLISPIRKKTNSIYIFKFIGEGGKNKIIFMNVMCKIYLLSKK